MHPNDCPQYMDCSAAICPLDAHWKFRGFGAGDVTCLFLRESMKEGADERLGSNEVWSRIHAVCRDWIVAEKAVAEHFGSEGMPMGRGSHLRVVLQAANSGSTLEKWASAGRRLAASRKSVQVG